jgi:hypothetical protein
MSDLAYMLSDEAGAIGPLDASGLRNALAATEADQPLVRAASCDAWLAAAAWEACGDLRPAPPVPPLPAGGVAMTLPSELAPFPADVRERLLWFVQDKDGVMGPVSGEFVRKGLVSGKVAAMAGVCLVTSSNWVRAATVFPRALEAATVVGQRRLQTFPCPACREPCAPGDRTCSACDEPVSPPPPPLTRERQALLLGAAWLAVLVIGLLLALVARLAAPSS